MQAEYSFHPYADRFPLMSGPEFEALKKDIAENGLKEPIRLYKEQVLDGRNRYKACTELGIRPRFQRLDISDEEAKAISISANLQRRHLSKSQQAMYLVHWGFLGEGKSSGAKRRYRTGDSAIRRIGERYGVSHVSIYKAMFVHDSDPKLADAVLDGKLSVAKAEQMIRDGRGIAPAASVRDSGDQPVPRRLKPLFRLSDVLGNAGARLSRAGGRLEGLPEEVRVEARKAQEHLQIAAEALRSITTYFVCRKCSGKGCTKCAGTGWQFPVDRKRATGAS